MWRGRAFHPWARRGRGGAEKLLAETPNPRIILNIAEPKHSLAAFSLDGVDIVAGFGRR